MITHVLFDIGDTAFALLAFLAKLACLVVCLRYRRLSPRIHLMTAGFGVLVAEGLAFFFIIFVQRFVTVIVSDYEFMRLCYMGLRMFGLIGWGLLLGGLISAFADFQKQIRSQYSRHDRPAPAGDESLPPDKTTIWHAREENDRGPRA
jgi:hypothetical protein